MSFVARTLRRWYRGIPQDESGRLLWGRYLRNLFLKLMAWFLGLSILWVLLYAVLPVPLTPLMVQRCGQQAWDSNRDLRLKHDWVSFSNISPNLQLAVVCAEDQEFLEHAGFDFEAIDKAIEYNQTHKRKRGASTISQQTAKNVFLWPSRSWLRKGFEVYFTFLIEVLWSKERIMTVYLNSIEFGDGIYGAEAAAQHYFRKNARDLNPDQAALMAAVLPNPLVYKMEAPTAKITKRQRWIKRQMYLWDNKIDYDNPNTPKAEGK